MQDAKYTSGGFFLEFKKLYYSSLSYKNKAVQYCHFWTNYVSPYFQPHCRITYINVLTLFSLLGKTPNLFIKIIFKKIKRPFRSNHFAHGAIIKWLSLGSLPLVVFELWALAPQRVCFRLSLEVRVLEIVAWD